MRDIAGAMDFPGIPTLRRQRHIGIWVKDFDAADQAAPFRDDKPAMRGGWRGITASPIHQSRPLDSRSVAKLPKHN
jgi:hypothetical protein